MKKIRRKVIIEEIVDEKGNVLEEISRETFILGTEGCVDFKACTNYLIQFFCKTGRKYSCTRMKIAKLLSILDFKYAHKGKELFHESIYWDKFNTIINELKFDYSIDIYNQRGMLFFDENKMINPNEVKEDSYIPNHYMVLKKIPDDVMKDIEELFYNFGAYTSANLTMLLKPIMEHEGVCRADSSIDLEAIANLDKNQFPGNKVVEYMFS